MHRLEDANTLDYIRDDVRTTLVEPEPSHARSIRPLLKGYPKVTLHEVAIVDQAGPVELVRRGPSTYDRRIDESPAVVNDGYRLQEQDVVRVVGVRFDRIDDGTIDLLCVDIEGGEWAVLKHLISRPGAISLETHGAAYLNPHLQKIESWMRRNGYRLLYRDRTDTVYVDPNRIPVTFFDRFRLGLSGLRIALRRLRKRV